MRVAHIVGNGFDISSGLNTSARKLISELEEIAQIAPLVPQGIKLLAEDIQDKGIKYWSDFEVALGEATSYESFAKSPHLFLEGKNEFERILSELLKKRVALIDDVFIDKNANSCIKSLGKIQTSMQEGELASFNRILSSEPHRWDYWHTFITLNYTPTLELLTHKFDKSQAFVNGGAEKGSHYISDLIYAHGSFADAPICGVNDASQIKNENFRKDIDVSSMLIKENAQHDFGVLNDEKALRVIENSSLICTFGVSFGKSDKRWWTAILDRLIKNRTSALILFDTKYSSNYNLTWDKRRARTNAIERFLTASEANSEIWEAIAERIFVLPSEKFFVIEEPLSFRGLSDNDLLEIANRLYQKDQTIHRRISAI